MSAGFAGTSAGFAGTSACFAKTSVGFAKTSVGFAETSADFADPSAGLAGTSAGSAETSVGFAETSVGFADPSDNNPIFMSVLVALITMLLRGEEPTVEKFSAISGVGEKDTEKIQRLIDFMSSPIHLSQKCMLFFYGLSGSGKSCFAGMLQVVLKGICYANQDTHGKGWMKEIEKGIKQLKTLFICDRTNCLGKQRGENVGFFTKCGMKIALIMFGTSKEQCIKNATERAQIGHHPLKKDDIHKAHYCQQKDMKDAPIDTDSFGKVFIVPNFDDENYMKVFTQIVLFVIQQSEFVW
jgi:hypothetical protein